MMEIFICHLAPSPGLWVLCADKNQGQPRVWVFTAESLNLVHPRVYLAISMVSASILNLFWFNFGFLPSGFCVCVCKRQREKERRRGETQKEVEKRDFAFFSLLINIHWRNYRLKRKYWYKIKFVPSVFYIETLLALNFFSVYNIFM